MAEGRQGGAGERAGAGGGEREGAEAGDGGGDGEGRGGLLVQGGQDHHHR